MNRSAFWPCLIITAVSVLPGCKPTESPSTGESAASPTAPAITAPEVLDNPSSLSSLKEQQIPFKQHANGAITEVDFSGHNATDSSVTVIDGLMNLESLKLNEAQITEPVFRRIGQMPTLRNLDLRGATVTNRNLEHLAGLTELKALRLSGKSGATQVDDDGLVHIGKMTNLKALLLDFLFVSDIGLQQLSGLKDLEELYLAGTLAGDDAIAVLKQFPKLKKLRLSQTQVSDEGLAGLKELSELQEIDLSENSLIFDGGLKHLGELKSLQKLNLWRVQVSNAGVEHLAGLTNLEWLNLDNTQLSDDGLPALKNMQKLKFLHLGSTLVSDAGLVHLEGLTALEDLKVTRTAVTAEGVAALQKKLPSTEIQLKYIEGE